MRSATLGPRAMLDQHQEDRETEPRKGDVGYDVNHLITRNTRVSKPPAIRPMRASRSARSMVWM